MDRESGLLNIVYYAQHNTTTSMCFSMNEYVYRRILKLSWRLDSGRQEEAFLMAVYLPSPS